MDDKAFYWKCYYCGQTLKDGDEAVWLYDTLMSGNTPVHLKGKAFHKQCFSNWFNEKGNWLFKMYNRR